MPHIIPIRDLKDTTKIAEMCHNSDEPIFITKNGYGSMVIMSLKHYEETLYFREVYQSLEKSEEDIKLGRTEDAKESLKKIRAELNI